MLVNINSEIRDLHSNIVFTEIETFEKVNDSGGWNKHSEAKR